MTRIVPRSDIGEIKILEKPARTLKPHPLSVQARGADMFPPGGIGGVGAPPMPAIGKTRGRNIEKSTE